MQVWKKNFLTAYALFLLVICGGLLLLDGYISKNELEQWVEHVENSERSLFYLASGLKEEELSRMSMNLNAAAENYLQSGAFTRVRVNTYRAADYLPEELNGVQAVEIREYRGEEFLIIREEKEVDGDKVEVAYAESLKELLWLQERRLWTFCAVGLMFSAGMGGLLYCTMRRINRPVNQIAHELRTPLTGIRGYAEYLMMGKLTEEDRFFAAKQIVDSAKSLESITEKLLIMGNVREGALQIRRIDVRRLLHGLKEKYPDIGTDCRLDYLKGDETLVNCLLQNLTANALSAGSHVRVTADEKCICVWNDGEILDEKLLRAINKGQELSGMAGFRAGKHGYGIQVCREIALAHGWKLRYTSGQEEGTRAVCWFGQP